MIYTPNGNTFGNTFRIGAVELREPADVLEKEGRKTIVLGDLLRN